MEEENRVYLCCNANLFLCGTDQYGKECYECVRCGELTR